MICWEVGESQSGKKADRKKQMRMDKRFLRAGLGMAAIALWVLAEKSLRFGGHLARAAGIGLIACGGASLVATGI